jgi:NAD(P)-dependent dehydrogenase (short-subunit alcohol dehydrogenase family)
MIENIFGKPGWTPERLENLKGKTYIITGANVGIGYEASKTFLKKGAKVVMLNRNEQKTTNAITQLKKELGADIDVSYIIMDLESLSSVRKAANEIINTISTFDAFICNAAVGQHAKQEISDEGFEKQLGINHYGHFLLLNLMFQKIKEVKARIVIVGSNGYNMGLKHIQFEDMNFDKNYSPMRTYAHSKLAQMMFAYELQRKIKENNGDTEVYVCHPGASKTTLGVEEANLMTRILFKVMSFTPLAQSAENGSRPTVMCATENNLKQQAYYGPTKRMDLVGPVGECKLEPHALDKVASQKLWDLSEKETNCTWKF